MRKESALQWLVAGLVLSYVGCASQDKQTPQPASGKYEGWKTYIYQNITIVYPPGHPLESELGSMAAGYIAGIERDCRFLQIEVPRDRLVIYYYTGFGHGRSITGREYPFARGDTIHFWLPSFYGPTLMEYLLPKWNDREPKHRFLRHGLIALLDYSGQDYHKLTLGFVEGGRFIPLRDLATDTTVDSNKERYQTAEAASFVDFLTYYYDIGALKLLYSARAPFEQSVEGIFMIPVDSLQGLWLDFVKERVQADSAAGTD